MYQMEYNFLLFSLFLEALKVPQLAHEPHCLDGTELRPKKIAVLPS